MQYILCSILYNIRIDSERHDETIYFKIIVKLIVFIKNNYYAMYTKYLV